jgi:hypothetical protein
VEGAHLWCAGRPGHVPAGASPGFPAHLPPGLEDPFPGDFHLEVRTGSLRWAAPDRGVLDLTGVDVEAVLPDITGPIGWWIKVTYDAQVGV